MYHAFVKRRIRARFQQQLSHGDHAGMLDRVAPTVTHFFPGRGALAGTRHSREALGHWFQRMFRLFPVLRFAVDDVAVAGGPWRTLVTVRWRDWGEAADGRPYENTGCELIEMRWGRVTMVGAYLDTELVSEALERMAAAGIEEAAAPPILDARPAAETGVATLTAPG